MDSRPQTSQGPNPPTAPMAIPTSTARPASAASLLPSPFPPLTPSHGLSPHAEGYEGDRLHAMFASGGTQPISRPRSVSSGISSGIAAQAARTGSLPELVEGGAPDGSVEDGRAPFSPLFTLVTDQRTRVTHHPHVHYIFSDDDPDALTRGVLDSLRGGQDASSREVGEDESEDSRGEDSRDKDSRGEDFDDVEERRLILTLTPSGRNVAAGRSLSPGWAVVSADVGRAPSVGANADGDGAMVRIVGTDAEETGEAQRDEEGEGDEAGDVNAMIKAVEGLARAFDGEMGVLRRLVAEGDEGGG